MTEQQRLQRSDLVAYFMAGCKPKTDWRIGLEFERFGFNRADFRPIPYHGDCGVMAIFNILMRDHGWQPIWEQNHVIGLQKNNQAITLEPGGQIELSDAPRPSIHHCCKYVRGHITEVGRIADELNIGFLGIGFHPKSDRADFEWVPKSRYAIMRQYMPKRGDMGIDMMLRTGTVQVNLDFASESDMIEKMRIGMALQPIVGAMFANSPFKNGSPTGMQSYRNHVWLHTDPDRTGMLPFVFDASMSFERYVDYVLDVPMYFVYRDGRYIDAAGQSFRDFIDGRSPVLPGQFATINDFIMHTTCVFPNVRLKQWLEMRGADGGEWGFLCALPALWVGLLYDDAAQKSALQLIKDWNVTELMHLQTQTPRTGLQTPFRNRKVLDIAKDVLAIAKDGLKNRKFLDHDGFDERYFLSPIERVIESGKTASDNWMAKFTGEWNGDINRIFTEKVWDYAKPPCQF